jgi:hypothetical protein
MHDKYVANIARSSNHVSNYYFEIVHGNTFIIILTLL